MESPNGRGDRVIGFGRVEAEALLYREAWLLDHQDFQGWLDLYTEDALFWMPAWRDDNTLTEDPERELSLIYYNGKDNLRDRVNRLTTGLSPVSRTLPRVTHLITNVMVESSDNAATVRSCFVTHAFSPRTDRVSSHFGHYEHGLRKSEGEWLICRKFIRLANDLIPTVLDINAL
jgi:3-phenylpropionate/cinnamic acid dioxygenase small subunit